MVAHASTPLSVLADLFEVDLTVVVDGETVVAMFIDPDSAV